MRTADVLEFFNNHKGKSTGYGACWKMLGLSSGTVSLWKGVVPRGLAFELQVLTDGLLKVDLSCYEPQKRDSEERQKALAELVRAKKAI